ncbi:hypothetical protein ACQ4PT_008163 [Festuca glaucescens]
MVYITSIDEPDEPERGVEGLDPVSVFDEPDEPERGRGLDPAHGGRIFFSLVRLLRLNDDEARRKNDAPANLVESPILSEDNARRKATKKDAPGSQHSVEGGAAHDQIPCVINFLIKELEGDANAISATDAETAKTLYNIVHPEPLEDASVPELLDNSQNELALMLSSSALEQKLDIARKELGDALYQDSCSKFVQKDELSMAVSADKVLIGEAIDNSQLSLHKCTAGLAAFVSSFEKQIMKLEHKSAPKELWRKELKSTWTVQQIIVFLSEIGCVRVRRKASLLDLSDDLARLVMQNLSENSLSIATSSARIFSRAAFLPCHCQAVEEGRSWLVGAIAEQTHQHKLEVMRPLLRYDRPLLTAAGAFLEKYITFCSKNRQWIKVVATRSGSINLPSIPCVKSNQVLAKNGRGKPCWVVLDFKSIRTFELEAGADLQPV